MCKRQLGCVRRNKVIKGMCKLEARVVGEEGSVSAKITCRGEGEMSEDSD